MRLIKWVHDHSYDFHVKVKHLVEARRSAKQTEVREKINAEIRAKNEEMQRRLAAKENLRVKKFGKPVTSRSAKPKIKQKVTKKVIDEKTQDEITYLGLELKDVPDDQGVEN